MWLGLAVLLVCAQVVRAAPEQGAPAGDRAAKTVRYVRFDIDGSLPESRPPIYLFPTEEETLYELVGRIDKASADPGVQGVIVRLGPLDAGWAKVQEVRQALLRCKKAGKDVICLMEEAGNIEYYLACSADTIDMAPAGGLMLMGLRMEAMFAKDLLDKIGVKGDFVEVGKSKGSPETFTRTEPTAPFRESLDSLVQDYFDQMVTGIVEGRKMPVSKVGLLIRRGPYSASGARDAGLVDDVLYYDELVSRLEARYGQGFRVETDYASSKPASPSADAGNLLKILMGMGGPSRPSLSRRPVIAVVHAGGPIVREDSDTSLFGSEMTSAEDMVVLLHKLADSPRVRAIVLRVDSPGGSALASDLIWRAVRLADKRKPVIASFSDTAASGGYYIASGARKIFADPGTLTGSIGIFGGKLVLGELLDKIGIHVTVIEKGGDTGLMSSLQEFTPEQRQKLQGLLEDGYQLFLDRVAQTRQGMSAEQVDRVAQGRVWTGEQARRNGLVDALGGLSEAIQAAKEAAGLAPDAPVDVDHLPHSHSLAEMILFGAGEGGGGGMQLPGTLGALMLPPVRGLRNYVGSLMALRKELSVCVLPALISVR